MLFSVCVTGFLTVFQAVNTNSVPEYEIEDEMLDAGLYMQQYTYNLFKLDSLFLSRDLETEEETTEPLREVTVIDAGEKLTFYSKDMTVKQFLEENYIVLGEQDSLNVSEELLLSEVEKIEINRVGVSLQTEIQYTNFKTKTSRVYFLAAINQIPANVEGVKGKTKLTYRCTYENGKLVDKQLVSKNKISNPVDAINYVVYTPEWERYGLDMSYVVGTAQYRSTAYSSEQKNLSYCTAMGYHTDYGIAAVSYKNPGAVRMGMWVYVSCPGLNFDYGYAYVCDTSHSSSNDWMDLHFETVREAKKWGRRNITVYILSGKPPFVDEPERFKR